MKSHLSKAALLAALSLAGVTAAKAESYGDLIVGFTITTGTDVFADLGNVGTLYNNETWTPSSLNIALGSLSSYSWGVLGDATAADAIAGVSRNTVFITGRAPSPTGNINAVDSGINTILNNFPGGEYNTYPGNTASVLASYDQSWNMQTINGTLTTDIINSIGNPNTTGVSSTTLWELQANNSAPTVLGTFALGSDGTLTYNLTQSVPEPATLGLFGGAGLLALVFRHKLGRKQS